jgi:hypothetical protein
MLYCAKGKGELGAISGNNISGMDMACILFNIKTKGETYLLTTQKTKP